MATLQFKRVFNYTGSFEDAVYNIENKLTPMLGDGEPLLCSYKEDGVVRYFLAVGIGEGKVVVHPTFEDQSDFIASIKKYAGVDLTEMIAEDSDFSVYKNPATNKYTLKIKDNILSINWIQL